MDEGKQLLASDLRYDCRELMNYAILPRIHIWSDIYNLVDTAKE